MPRNRIRELRTARGLSQKDLAGQLGVDPATVSRWETGRSIPDRAKQHLAEELKVSVAFLMGWTDGEGNDSTRGA